MTSMKGVQMTAMIDRPNAPVIINFDSHEFALFTTALDHHGIPFVQRPGFPNEWIAPCPVCRANGNPGGMVVFPWQDHEHAGAVAFECQSHFMYDIGRALGIRTRLMAALDEGRAELARIRKAMRARSLTFGRRPELVVDGYGQDAHVGQCPVCVANHRPINDMTFYVDSDVAGGDNPTFGHVRATCHEAIHEDDAILPELGIITRYALRHQFGAIDWDAPDPEPTWLIEDLVEPGQFAVIYGPAGEGKSLFAQDQAFQLAEQDHRVLYLDHENPPGEIKARRDAMGRGGQLPAALSYLTFPPVSGIDTPAGAARLLALVEASGATVVFLDTWSKFVEGDESSPSTHTAAYRLAIVPLRRKGVTVVALDHSGKDLSKGPRGGSSKGDNVDVLWLLTAKGADRIRLERRKTRTGRGPDILTFDRLDTPLRHQRAEQRTDEVLTQGVRTCVLKLDALEVPFDWGRERVLKLLRKVDYKVRNDTVSAAIKVRRERGESSATALHLVEEEQQ